MTKVVAITFLTAEDYQYQVDAEQWGLDINATAAEYDINTNTISYAFDDTQAAEEMASAALSELLHPELYDEDSPKLKAVAVSQM